MKKVKIDKKKLRRLEPSKNYFASLVRSIIYQQLAGTAAAAILKKFLALFPRKKFPKSEDVLALTDAQFKSAGISAQKARYLRDLAAKFLDGTITPKHFSKMTDAEIKEHLVRVKGIGSWTADMFLIFALNRPNVLPVGDLGIQKGFQICFKLRTLPTEKQMRLLAKAHEGDYTRLALHLWGLADAAKAVAKAR